MQFEKDSKIKEKHMIKTLFFASNPEGTSPLMLDEEIRTISEKIRASDYRDVLELVSLWAVRPDDLEIFPNVVFEKI
jgi:hypothetical protein